MLCLYPHPLSSLSVSLCRAGTGSACLICRYVTVTALGLTQELCSSSGSSAYSMLCPSCNLTYLCALPLRRR